MSKAVKQALAATNGGPGLTADELAERFGTPPAFMRNHHSTAAEAHQLLQDLDWRQARDGSWLCEECWDEAVGELPCPHGGRCTPGSCCLPDGPEVATA